VIPPIFDFIYPGLQNYINRIPLWLRLYKPVLKHQNVLCKHIKIQVDKRLREKQKYGDLWKRPNDLLQGFLDEESFDPNNIDYLRMAERMAKIIFTSIHTTANACASVVVDLASRPEYVQELFEEQLEVHQEADENGVLPFEALNKMKKLDSFVKESLRLNVDVASLPHLTMKDFTFSNGLQVPKDRVVEIYFNDFFRDESSQGPNPKSFDPYRDINKTPASKISKNYIVFGSGKHA